MSNFKFNTTEAQTLLELKEYKEVIYIKPKVIDNRKGFEYKLFNEPHTRVITNKELGILRPKLQSMILQ